jgi:transposase
MKALVALEHAMLIYFTRLNPDKAKNRAIDQLKRMGYAVTLDPLAVAG